VACIGEGEETLVELVRNIKNGQDFHNVRGIWFKDGEKIVRNKLRPLIQDLDSIPFPDYDYEDHYTDDGRDHNLPNSAYQRMSIWVYILLQ